MFGFFSKKGETKKLLYGGDPQAENIFIHSMARDLESGARSEKDPAKDTEPESTPSASRIKLTNLTAQQKTSPFLNKRLMSETIAPVPNQPKVEIANNPSIPPASQIRDFAPPRLTSNTARPVFEKVSPKNIFSKTKEPKFDLADVQKPGGRNIKKLVLTLSIILIATIILAGTYYFWSTRKISRDAEPVAGEAPTAEKTETIPGQDIASNAEPAVSKFSTSGPNYLEVDINDSSPEAMKETLKSYVQEVQASGISGAAEFKIVTLEKSPISLSTFLEKMKITFSPELASSLEDDFSLYIYNDQGGPGVGLSIAAKKEADLEDVLINEEGNLPGELAPLFPIAEYTIEKNKKFNSSQYDTFSGVTIRYLNIISPESLSVDYAIYKQKLIIGTTRQTLRSIVDKLNGVTTVSTDTNSIPSVAYQDFLGNFKSCTPATTDNKLVDGLTYKYKIIGIKNEFCSVESSFTQNPNPDWIGKEMTCSYDNSKEFQAAILDLSRCTGQLYDLMGKPTSATPL